MATTSSRLHPMALLLLLFFLLRVAAAAAAAAGSSNLQPGQVLAGDGGSAAVAPEARQLARLARFGRDLLRAEDENTGDEHAASPTTTTTSVLPTPDLAQPRDRNMERALLKMLISASLRTQQQQQQQQQQQLQQQEQLQLQQDELPPEFGPSSGRLPARIEQMLESLAGLPRDEYEVLEVAEKRDSARRCALNVISCMRRKAAARQQRKLV